MDTHKALIFVNNKKKSSFGTTSKKVAQQIAEEAIRQIGDRHELEHLEYAIMELYAYDKVSFYNEDLEETFRVMVIPQ